MARKANRMPGSSTEARGLRVLNETYSNNQKEMRLSFLSTPGSAAKRAVRDGQARMPIMRYCHSVEKANALREERRYIIMTSA